MDEEEKSYSSSEFAKLGFKHVVLVSAEHGHGIDKLSKLLLSLLPSPPPLSADPDESRTRIAFIGRPNVGKSSLCNRLLDMERLIVSDVPGTTRETVELDLDYIAEEGNEPWKFRLFDTAGLKRRKRVDSSLIIFPQSGLNMQLRRLILSFLFLMLEKESKQDKILAGHVLEEGRHLHISE